MSDVVTPPSENTDLIVSQVVDSNDVASDAESSTQAAQQQLSIGELFQPASLKGNATPKFWSGDNPIVVTMVSLGLLGAIATGLRTNSALTIDAMVLGAGLVFGLTRLTLD